MGQPVRLYDTTTSEYVEVMSNVLAAALEAAIKRSEEIREEYMDRLDRLIKDKEEAISLMPVILSKGELVSKASEVRDCVMHVNDITDRINRFSALARNYMRMPVPCLVRLTVAQAQEIGL